MTGDPDLTIIEDLGVTAVAKSTRHQSGGRPPMAAQRNDSRSSPGGAPAPCRQMTLAAMDNLVGQPRQPVCQWWLTKVLPANLMASH